MVFFSCNACGESLKKNQVEKHYMTKCRNCDSLSCIDCNKVFWGDEYQEHTKCISEEEKYSGKNFVPKPGANKGEVKQNQWFQQVQAAIEKNQSNKRLRNVLEKLQEYPNVPRKKKKFENFAKSSLNVRDPGLIEQVWDGIMANIQTTQSNGDAQNGSSEGQHTKPDGVQKQTDDTKPSEAESETVAEKDSKKLSKREKKEERSKKANKKEKKDKQSVDDDEDKKNGKKKKKKRKREDSECGAEEEEEMACKKRTLELSKECMETSSAQEEEEEEVPVKRSKVKFDWIAVITTVLKKKGEISVKKLRKKVLAEYASQKGDPGSPEKLYAKFNKKIQKNPTFVVLKDRVKLKAK